MEIEICTERDSENRVHLSFFAETILSRVLGGRYYNWHGYRLSEREWKNIIKKLLRKLELAIDINVYTDTIHIRNIKHKLQHMRDSLAQKKTVDPELVLALIGLSFELLGGMPDNHTRKYGNKPHHFKLDQHRSLLYSQVAAQKVWTIFESAHYDQFKQYYTHQKIADKYYTEFVGKPAEFISWFKRTYPAQYAELF